MIQNKPAIVVLPFHNLKTQLKWVTAVSLVRNTIERIVQKREIENDYSAKLLLVVAFRGLNFALLVIHIGILTLLIGNLLCAKHNLDPQRFNRIGYRKPLFQSLRGRICESIQCCSHYFRDCPRSEVDLKSNEPMEETEEGKDPKDLKILQTLSVSSVAQSPSTSVMQSASHFHICGFPCRRRRYVDANAAVPAIVNEEIDPYHTESLSWNLRVKDS